TDSAGIDRLEAIRKVSHGTRPRYFRSLKDESKHHVIAPHAYERHILRGKDHIYDKRTLALRAAFHHVSSPGQDGIASAWISIKAANREAKAILANLFNSTNWPANRKQLVGSGKIEDTSNLHNSGGLKAFKNPNGSVKYPDSDWPYYLRTMSTYSATAVGKAPLFASDKRSRAWSTCPPQHKDDSATPLVSNAVQSLNKVFIRVKAHKDIRGGWGINTMFPKA
ncbi:MAG: hypothetical protein AAFS10_19895, partial [Myxococcota bacterium]